MKFEYQWRHVEFHDQDIEKRIHSSIVSADNQIFLFGGNISNTDIFFNDIFEYEPAVGVWHRLEVTGDIPSPRFKANLRYYNRKIYLYGGLNKTQTFSDIYIFDPSSLIWTLEEPKEYSQAPVLQQQILSVQLKYPYLILVYNGIADLYSPVIWVYTFADKQWKSIQFKNSTCLWTNNNSSCMVGNYIYIFGRSSVNEAPSLTECNFTKLISRSSYEDVPIIRYVLSDWKDNCAVYGEWLCIQGYNGQIIVVYNIKGSLHTNKLITINMLAKRKYYCLERIYGNLINFRSCRATMSGSCLVAVGQLCGNKAQKMFYINIALNKLPPYRYTLHKKLDEPPKNEEKVILFINGIQFQINKVFLTQYSYFQNMLVYNNPEQNCYEINIMKMKKEYLQQMVNFIKKEELRQINKEKKEEQFVRLINLAYLADYFCIERLKLWVQDHIYSVCENENNMETITLANALSLSKFEQYCSARYIKSLYSPKQIKRVFKGTYDKALTKKIKLNEFDLQHRCLNNSTRHLGADFSIPREFIKVNKVASTFLTDFQVMMEEESKLY